ncbi:MAG: phosphoribosylglycinamide formyltransferase [Planctomycetota bacterium]
MNFRISVLISGGGTTLRNLIQYRDKGKLNVDFAHVISNNPNAGGLEFAHDAKIPYSVINHRDFDDEEAFSDEMFKTMIAAETDLVVMGGFLRRLKIPTEFTNRVVNIHPSLIPAFCGKGNYGSRVHQAVIEYGCKVSGCTVHFVDDHYDHGPIIAQSTVPVFVDDDALKLAARVFDAECQLYPAVIEAIGQGSITIDGRKVSWNKNDVE